MSRRVKGDSGAQPFVASFAWNDAGVALSAPDAWLASEVSRFVALPYAVPAHTVAADIIVTPDRRIVWREGRQRFECSTDDDLVMTTVAILSSCLLEQTARVVLHTGAFVVDGYALLFAGPEFVGKSSLAVVAWRSGFTLMGDDWVALSDRLRVRSFPKPLKTRDSVEAIVSGPERQPAGGDVLCGRLMGGEHRCMYSRALAGMLGYETELPIGALFLLGRIRRLPTTVAPASRERALTVVLEQTMHTRASGLGAVKMLEQLALNGAVFECQIGERDFEGAVAQMAAVQRRRQGER